MKRVGVAELKNNLSKHLRLVEGGEAIEVTDHDRAVAHLVPIEVKTRLRLPRRPFADIANKVYPPIGDRVDYVELLLEDRRQR
ncbi:MAG: type II toxin-antitoxin system Phd/YefM family antitoxin [Chloroflexota bacterium]